jgi:ribosome biogenesis GTPase
VSDDGVEPGRVLAILASTYVVERDGEPVECVLAGRLRRGPRDRVVTGDRVMIERLEDGSARIVKRLPRRSRLARRPSHGRGLQVIAANIDLVAIVFAAARPEPDPAMLDRLLVLAELSDLPALVVVNKMDLADETGRPDPLAPFEAARRAGYRLLPTSARTGSGLDDLRQTVSGAITVLAGPSGTGKSSLLNALLPEAELRVASVSQRTGRGRHTTVAARLFPMPGGGYLGDTPGLQYAGLPDVSPAELGRAFPELRKLAGQCRFADCLHRAEPDCAVRQAVEDDHLSRSRYRSYLTLLEEVEARTVTGREGGR